LPSQLWFPVSKVDIDDFVLCIPIRAFADESAALIVPPKIFRCPSCLNLFLKEVMT